MKLIPAILLLAAVYAHAGEDAVAPGKHLTTTRDLAAKTVSVTTFLLCTNSPHTLIFRIGCETQADGTAWCSLRTVLIGPPPLLMRETNAVTITGEENRMIFPVQTSCIRLDENGVVSETAGFSITSSQIKAMTLSRELRVRVYGKTGSEDFILTDPEGRLNEMADYAKRQNNGGF